MKTARPCCVYTFQCKCQDLCLCVSVKLDVSLFDFLDGRFQVDRSSRVVGVGVVLLVGHFQDGTVETVDKVVHLARFAGVRFVHSTQPPLFQVRRSAESARRRESVAQFTATREHQSTQEADDQRSETRDHHSDGERFRCVDSKR